MRVYRLRFVFTPSLFEIKNSIVAGAVLAEGKNALHL